MKVKVIKANLSSYWYADNVGKVYDVEEVQLGSDKFEYKVIGSELGGTKYFDKDDVEIINEENEVKTFTKADLRTGMRVVHGKHPRHTQLDAIVVRDLGQVLFKDGGYNYLDSYDNNLGQQGSVWDITEVYDVPMRGVLDFNVKGDLLWKLEKQTPEQKQLQVVMTKISELQAHAKNLQELINK